MATLIKRHPLVSFFVIAYVIVWVFSIPSIAISQGWLDPAYSGLRAINIISNFSPAIAAIVVTAVVQGRSGVRALLSRLRSSGIPIYWYAAAVLLPLVINLVGQLAAYLISGTSPHLPGMSWYLFPVYFAGIFVIVGLAEEIGWRGFALPNLQHQHTALVSSVILGVLWGLWHLPTWWIPGTVQHDLSLPVYVAGTVGFTIILTWLFNSSEGALVLPVLMHTATNTISGFLPVPTPNGLPIQNIVTWGVALILIAVAGAAHLSKRRVESTAST
ncbi:MAG: CPBP family intramembrane metalloprotease [Anaerolineae bacterium]|nr:CPBP family intramembrane metalloprotease [Anaerolineae bacterium]